MAHTATWDAAYEADPADATDDIGDGGSDIRLFKRDVRERIAQDHYMDIAGTDADHGEHSKVTFQAPYAPGSPGANKGFLYIKDVNAKAELHFKDEDDNEVVLTSAGSVNESIPSGSILLFESDTAIVGYTLQTDVDDKLVFISKGSGAGGETGAGGHSTGTWTQPDHTLSVAEMPSHEHVGFKQVAAGTGNTIGSNAIGAAGTGDSDGGGDTESVGGGTAHSHGTAWRPDCRVFTRQQKD